MSKTQWLAIGLFVFGLAVIFTLYHYLGGRDYDQLAANIGELLLGFGALVGALTYLIKTIGDSGSGQTGHTKDQHSDSSGDTAGR